MDDLEDFIASDDDNRYKYMSESEESEESEKEQASEEEDDHKDRVGDILRQLKPNENYTQKVLRGHISVLVLTLGGPDHTSSEVPTPYNLGPDALPCLKDIKRWIQTVDQKHAKFDVALAIAECGLVVNDLVVILCDWDRKAAKTKKGFSHTILEKIALACLELLVSLTWPYEITDQLTPAQRDQFSDLRKAQLVYKKHLLAYNSGQTLRAVLRLALPCLAQDRRDRDPRDTAILRLVVYLFRNLLYLEPADPSITKGKQSNYSNLPSGVLPEDISLNTVIDSYKRNKVLMFLLTMCGSIGNDLDKQTFGHVLLECVNLLVRGVDIPKLLSPTLARAPPAPDAPIPSASSVSGLQLEELLKEENRRKNRHRDTISTRHGRFGSLLAIQDDNSSYVVSGQEALVDRHHTLEKLDSTKKWRAPTLFRYDSDKYITSVPPTLTAGNTLILKEFIEQFLASGSFNNVVHAVSWLLANSFTSLADSHMLGNLDKLDVANYFALVAWFFNYKRQRNAHLSTLDKTPAEDEDQLDWGSVGAALSEVNFVLVGQYLREAFSAKDWNSLHVALICLREMLLIAYTIFQAPSDANTDDISDKELAEGIIRKLFGEADYVSLLVQIPRTASKHSPRYLNVVVSVVSIILRSFESFANQDVKLYMRSRRKQQEDLSDTEEYETSKRVIRERQLDFRKTEAQFFHKDTVGTHIVYLSRYEELSHDDIKRCISYFHKLFVVRKEFTGLYRLDFMHTLYRLRNGLPRSASIRKHVDEFVYYFMKKFKVAFDRFPMPIEILFPRFEDSDTKSYLATGQILDDHYKPSRETELDENEPGYVDDWIPEPKKAKALRFKEDVQREDEISILVLCLCQSDKEWLVEWLISEHLRILEKRVLETSVDVLMPTASIRHLLITNAYVRLLLERLGFQLPELQNDPTVLPGAVDNAAVLRHRDMLQEVLNAQRGRLDTTVFDQFTTRKQKEPRERKEGERKRRRRRDKALSEEAPASRYDSATAWKSAMYVNDLDDELDDERATAFFEKEEQLRKLIDERGGVVGQDQLKEFKETWSKLTGTEITPLAIVRSTSILEEVAEAGKAHDATEEHITDDETGDSDLGTESMTPVNRLSSPTQAEEDRPRKKLRLVISDDEEE